MKKKILLFGTMLASAIPVATVVSCGGGSTNKENTDVGSGSVVPRPVKPKRKVSQANIDLWKAYKDSLSNIAKAMNSVSQESSIKYLKIGGNYPKTMYFVGKDDKELKKLAKPILEKLGFSNDKKIPKNWSSLKAGDLYPDTNKRGSSIYNSFKIGYKDTKTGKFGIYQDAANRYDSASEAVDAFLGLSGTILPDQTNQINLLKFLEIGTGFGNKYHLINSFTKEFNDLGISHTTDLDNINKIYLTHKTEGDVDTENAAFKKITGQQITDLSKIVDKWIPGGESTTTTNASQKAIVIDAADGKFSKGSTTHRFSFKIEKDLGQNVSEGLKKSPNSRAYYFILYGALGNSKSANLSTVMSSADFLKGIEKFAIIDTGLNYHHKQIVFMFIKMKNKWMSWTDLLKYKDPNAKFILEDYWAEDGGDKTEFKDPNSSSSGSKFAGKGLDNYNGGEFSDLVKYVKDSLK